MNAFAARTAEPLPVWSGRSKQRNWLLTGLIVSLALHGVLCFFFYRTGFQPTAPLGMEKRQPPTFKVKSVETAPKPLDEAAASSIAEAAKPNPDQTNVQLPDDQKSFDQAFTGSALDGRDAGRHQGCVAGQTEGGTDEPEFGHQRDRAHDGAIARSIAERKTRAIVAQ